VRTVPAAACRLYDRENCNAIILSCAATEAHVGTGPHSRAKPSFQCSAPPGRSASRVQRQTKLDTLDTTDRRWKCLCCNSDVDADVVCDLVDRDSPSTDFMYVHVCLLTEYRLLALREALLALAQFKRGATTLVTDLKQGRLGVVVACSLPVSL
jgi:hypothetical protein